FSTFDKDNDGKITVCEVHKTFNSLGMQVDYETCEQMVKQVDLDGNGQIDFEEFILLTTRSENPQSEEREVMEMFRLIDKDHSGSIEVEELKEAFVTLGMKLTIDDLNEMMKQADINGDGKIDYSGQSLTS
ncbi:hypothetical protein HELRODRAFT_91152, partial [Helobdella robusta]|uniref:EF-hand domain-containing protein n=1 Tax=Helobdella robusta TaxID=6412 RepID=T1G804_HELRO